jgi:hypothetical protein
MTKTINLLILLLTISLHAMSQNYSPTEKHKKLACFIGKWQIEADMKETPFNPAGKFIGINIAEWGLDGLIVIVNSSGTGPSGPASELEIIGYDIQDDVYTYTAFNSQGWADRTSKGTLDGNRWTWTNESKSDGKSIRFRNVMNFISPTIYTFKSEMSVDGGTWAVVIEGKLTKIQLIL